MRNPFEIINYHFYNQLCGFGSLKNIYYIVCPGENVPSPNTSHQPDTESQDSSGLIELSEQQITAIRKLYDILKLNETSLASVQLITSPHLQTKQTADYLQQQLNLPSSKIELELQEPSLSGLEQVKTFEESSLILTRYLTSLICHLEMKNQQTIILVVHPQVALILINAFTGKMPSQKCTIDYAAPYLLELNPAIAEAYSDKTHQETIHRYKSPKDAKERCFSLPTDLCLTFEDDNEPTAANIVITTPRGAKYQYISPTGKGATDQAALYQADNRNRAFVVLSNHNKMNLDSLKRKYKFFRTCYDPKSVEVSLTYNNYYLAIPYFKGISLTTFVKQDRMNPAIIIEFCYQIALALNACHKKGWIVLDSSPGNIICDLDEASGSLNACSIIDGGYSFQVNEPVPPLYLQNEKEAPTTTIPPECLNRPKGHYNLKANFAMDVFGMARITLYLYRHCTPKIAMPEILSSLIDECVSPLPNNRPPFSKIIAVLEELRPAAVTKPEDEIRRPQIGLA